MALDLHLNHLKKSWNIHNMITTTIGPSKLNIFDGTRRRKFAQPSHTLLLHVPISVAVAHSLFAEPCVSNLLELLAPASLVGNLPSTADPIHISRSTNPCCFPS